MFQYIAILLQYFCNNITCYMDSDPTQANTDPTRPTQNIAITVNYYVNHYAYFELTHAHIILQIQRLYHQL